MVSLIIHKHKYVKNKKTRCLTWLIVRLAVRDCIKNFQSHDTFAIRNYKIAAVLL